MFGLSSSPIVTATLWVLIGFSLISWTLIATKGWLQWQLGRQNREFVKAFWDARSLPEAEAATAPCSGPLARLAQAGFAELHDLDKGAAQNLQHSGDKQDIVERRLRQQVQQEQSRLESGLMVLASIGSTAPFVGLFGTVWGIMHALHDIGKSGSAGLDVVAGPVGEALIATAIGIATAIPAVLAYNYGLRRMRVYVGELDNFAADFMRLAMKAGFRVGRD